MSEQKSNYLSFSYYGIDVKERIVSIKKELIEYVNLFVDGNNVTGVEVFYNKFCPIKRDVFLSYNNANMVVIYESINEYLTERH